MSIAHTFMRMHIHRACFMSIARYELCSYFGPMYEHSSCMLIFFSCMINVYHGLYHDPYSNRSFHEYKQSSSMIIIVEKGDGLKCHASVSCIRQE